MNGRAAPLRLVLCAALLVGCSGTELASLTGQRRGAATPPAAPAAPVERVELTAEQGARLLLEAWARLDAHVDSPDETKLLTAAWDGFLAALPAGQTRPAFPEFRGVNPEADLLRFRTAYLTAASQVPGGGDVQAQLAHSAIRRMVESIGDCLTTYTDGNQIRQQAAQLGGETRLGGVGIRIKRRVNETAQSSQPAPPRDPIVVWELLEGGAAGKAGVKPGDAIVMVDGKDVTQLSIEQIATTIRGPEGTQVKLTVEHPDGKRKEISVKRAAINEPAFQTRMLKGDVAYFRLLGFGATVQTEMLQAIRGHEAKNPKGWIVDLRTNASGDYAAMLALLSKVLKEGPFAYDQDQQGRRLALGPDGTYLPKQRPITLLVSDSTSSAAEVFTAAIQHYKVGTVIGTKTAGCAGISSRVELSDGSLMNVTLRRILAPGGVAISKQGVVPQDVVEVTRQQLAAGKDPQLDRALEKLGVR
ncbi:MAG: S41 family peptidase [Chloroflexota bacterium]